MVRSDDMRPEASLLRGWVPIRVYRSGPDMFVDWCYAGSQRFTHPFFRDTVQTLLARPFSLLFRHQTPLEFLTRLTDGTRALAPSGFIFHMSRCGSTLVTQMLAAVEKNIVISEAGPIDSVLSYGENGDAGGSNRVDALRAIVSAFGRERFGIERHYFVKFDSWNVIDLDRVREAFPDVPWLFLYRDPVEVIASQMRQRGSQMIPGAIGKTLPGIELIDAVRMAPEEYCARVLARICQSAADHAGDNNAMLLNYNQLPEAVFTHVLGHFRLTYEADELSRMRRASRQNAKTPQFVFEPDSDQKRAEATDAIRSAAAEWVYPVYERLETLRLSKGRDE